MTNIYSTVTGQALIRHSTIKSTTLMSCMRQNDERNIPLFDTHQLPSPFPASENPPANLPAYLPAIISVVIHGGLLLSPK